MAQPLTRLLLGFALCAPLAAQSHPDWRDLERKAQGRLGLAFCDLESGKLLASHRSQERFPFCSTFKVILVAAVLEARDQGRLRLETPVRLTRADLVPHAPVCEQKLAGGALSVGALCRAALEVSDNTAANLLLRQLGGPRVLTAFTRRLGDKAFRLDRVEPELNEAKPGDPRDTTTPESMARTLVRLLSGPELSESSRTQLLAWMAGSTTGTGRIRAGLPEGWKAWAKSGGGGRGTVNDIALVVSPEGAKHTLALYLTGSTADLETREAVLAEAARRVIGQVKP